MQSFTPGATSPAHLSVEAMCQLLTGGQPSPSPVPVSPSGGMPPFSRMSGGMAGALGGSDSGSSGLGHLGGDSLGSAGTSSAAVQALQGKLRASAQRVQELEFALHAKAQECSQLDATCKQRIQELEAMYAMTNEELKKQMSQHQSQQQLINNQQIQIVILEEQLKIATAAAAASGIDKVGSLGLDGPAHSASANDIHMATMALFHHHNSSARSSASGGPGATHPVAGGADAAKGLHKLPSLSGLKAGDRSSSHAGGVAAEFTRDQEVWPMGGLGGPSRTSTLLSSSSLAPDAWGLHPAAAAAAADAWPLPAMSQASAYGSLAPATWDAAATLLMSRTHSLADHLAGGLSDSDLYAAGLVGDASRLTSPHTSLTPHHLAGLLPDGFERYLDGAGSIEHQHSTASSQLEALRPQASLPRSGLTSMGSHRGAAHKGMGGGGGPGMLQRSASLPPPDHTRSHGYDQDRSSMLAAIKNINRKWTDTWGPELDLDDGHPDTDINDQVDGNGAQISPCGDGPDGDANAQDLDAGAQNARLRSKQDALPNTCVYVGFLGWWVTEKDLMEYFSPYGHLVSVRLLISKKSRRSREQAFVEYSSVDQAQKAITWLDSIDCPALVKQLGCGGLVVRFADRKRVE